MKIGLASDSFGNLDALERAFERLVAAGAERVFFLGGRYGDVDAVLARRRAGGGARAPEGGGGDLEFLRAVEGALIRQGRADDAGTRALEQRIVRLASRACPEYASDAAPRKVFEMAAGLICCLVHDKAELTREDIANATVLFHGNSAHPALVQIGPRFFVTPGHLRHPAPEGKPATFALVEVDAAQLALTVFGADGAELSRQRVEMGARSKVSVR